ncbi:manganese catalase family protein [Sphingomonas elodea]|uniref:manganese catalase family protein n=1 Tax=Sphingomonas elodea TaxID=179878 RepID=UPI0002631011|nr:manganese catalase family protein [Sphingomonas elodea]
MRGIQDALTFLMMREVAHQKSFEKALYAIEDNFPPGKLPGVPEDASMYVNNSQGEGDLRGPWNDGPEWERVDELEQVMPVDGGNGMPTVVLGSDDRALPRQLAERTIGREAT